MKNQQAEILKTKFFEAIEPCHTIEDYLDVCYNFSQNGFKVKPHQSKEELLALLDVLSVLKPKRILEIGTSEGGTLFLLCKVASPDSTLISIDLPEGAGGGELNPNWKKSFYESFISRNQKIHLLRENSHDDLTVKKVEELLDGKKLDFILIDGDHTYNSVKKDFQCYFPLFSNNGIIAFHDINEVLWENIGVKRFWNEIKSQFTNVEIIQRGINEGLGLGLIFNPLNKNNDLYVLALNQSIKIKNQIIKKLRNNPISAIMSFYEDRDDLQKAFPEVKRGNYERIINWAISTCESKREETIRGKFRLQKFYYWYKDYISKLKGLEKN